MDWISPHHHSWVCWNLAKWPAILPPNSLGVLPQRLTYIAALLCCLERRWKAVFCSPMPRVRGVVDTAIGKLFAPVTRGTMPSSYCDSQEVMYLLCFLAKMVVPLPKRSNKHRAAKQAVRRAVERAFKTKWVLKQWDDTGVRLAPTGGAHVSRDLKSITGECLNLCRMRATMKLSNKGLRDNVDRDVRWDCVEATWKALSSTVKVDSTVVNGAPLAWCSTKDLALAIPSRWRFCTQCLIYRSRQCICVKGCSDRLPNNLLIIEPWLFLTITQVSVNRTWGCGPFCRLFGNIVTRCFVFGTGCPNRVTIWTLTLETLTKGLCCLNGCGPLH